MGFFRLIEKGERPTRLFVGGVHGKEGLTTIRALKKLNFNDVKTGRLVIYNCRSSDYISTLDPDYYNSSQGKEIIRLIREYRPSTYVEAHCYRDENYRKLTDPSRKLKEGVPPLIELEKGVLIGSVSPHIRKSLFKRDDICLTVEIPCFNDSSGWKEQLEVYVDFLKHVAASDCRAELEERLTKKYPLQVETARAYAREFFGEYPPF